jgi:hypothetical protein
MPPRNQLAETDIWMIYFCYLVLGVEDLTRDSAPSDHHTYEHQFLD